MPFGDLTRYRKSHIKGETKKLFQTTPLIAANYHFFFTQNWQLLGSNQRGRETFWAPPAVYKPSSNCIKFALKRHIKHNLRYLVGTILKISFKMHHFRKFTPNQKCHSVKKRGKKLVLMALKKQKPFFNYKSKFKIFVNLWNLRLSLVQNSKQTILLECIEGPRSFSTGQLQYYTWRKNRTFQPHKANQV